MDYALEQKLYVHGFFPPIIIAMEERKPRRRIDSSVCCQIMKVAYVVYIYDTKHGIPE